MNVIERHEYLAALERDRMVSLEADVWAEQQTEEDDECDRCSDPDRCCMTHDGHVMPHRGCVLR